MKGLGLISAVLSTAIKIYDDLGQYKRTVKKEFNRVWHAALWEIMKEYNISANPFPVNKLTAM